ncbi:MAG: LamG domain-containing protein [Phycisphaerae bacterium]
MCKKLIYVVSFVLVLGIILMSMASAADPDLIGWWRLDSDAIDSSGNNHHGTIFGNPQWVAGKIGGALEFYGVDDRVEMPDANPAAGFAHEGEITWAAWVKTTEGGRRAIICQGPAGAAHVSGNKTLGIETAGTVTVRANGVGAAAGFTSNVVVTDDQWHHVAVTFAFETNGANDTMKVYIDGDLSKGYETDTVNINQNSAAATDFIMILGNNIGGAWVPYDGLMDDVRIYNRALSEAEILAAMEGAEGFPYAFGPAPVDGAMLEAAWANLSWHAGDFAVSHDVYIGENFDDVNNGAEGTFQGNQTGTFIVVGFPGFAYPDGLVPGTTYYWRIDEVNDTEPNGPWKGDVWSFSVPPKTAYAPNPADSAESVDPDAQLSWTPGFGAKLHTVYFGDNFDYVNNAAGGLPQGTATYTPPGPLKLAKTYYWRVDEFDVIETHKGDVWSFTTQGAVRSPDPTNGAVDVKQTQIITFSPSVFAASHQLYFGTDKDAVKNADTSSPEYKGTRDLGAESYDPGMLEWDTTYYWRIDEVNNANPDSPWPGILWSFTTANFLVVDDFESYNDIDPPDPESNRIFEAWPDGYDIPTNGALVGNDLPPYAEQGIVHSGIQSMPYIYDNSVGNSEATHTLTYPRDWTENGVSTLTIWFRGNSDNAAETLYVVLNGSAVINHDNPNAAQIGAWTAWNIDLQAFADQGVNLANVNTIGLGFGNRSNPQAGGSGKMYFDDICLYPPVP